MFYDQQGADAEHTITLSRKDLRAARRLLRLLLGAESEPGLDLKLSARSVEDGSRTALLAKAREEFGNRRRRLAVFDRAMFGEAAWDMLLALYIFDSSGQRQTLGTLVKLSGASMTTAIRWINFLAEHDLVRREAHPTDLRTSFITLTAKAREKLDLYYSETVDTGI